MKIVAIVGILDFPGSDDRLWRHFRQAFQREFPSSTFTVEHTTYLPWQRQRIRDFAKRIMKQHDTGEELILLGYSLGGVIADEVAQQLRHTKVRLVITVCAPHRLRHWWFSGVNMRIPILNFSAVFDVFVPGILAQHVHAPTVYLVADHLFGFLLSPRFAWRIASTAAHFLRLNR